MANSIFLWPGSISAGSITVWGTLAANSVVLDATNQDVVLVRDAANVLAQRNGTTAQTFRVYNTYTDASNYERGTMSFDSNILSIGFQGAGTGNIQRVVRLESLGTAFIDLDASANVRVYRDIIFNADNSNSIGTPTATRPASGYFGTSVTSPAFLVGGYLSGARSTSGNLQSVTTAVSVSGASTGTGNVIPAGATVVDIATTTTTTITGASGYQVGDGSDADRYGDITGTAVGTASGSTSYTADPRWWATSARAVTLTAKTSNFTGGVVQVTVFYMAATGA